MKIGILGGTFDPIHNGHLMIAEVARSRLGLDEVVFIPAGEPYLKADKPVSAAEHRVQMIRLALADKPHFRLSTVEIERPGPSYTVDTIAEMRAQLNREDELFFILGWENLPQLPQWHKPARLIEMCYLVAVPRPGAPRPDLKPLESLIPGLSRKVIFLDMPEIDISASAIRDQVARGLPIHHLVPEPVDKYIKEQGLYLSTT